MKRIIFITSIIIFAVFLLNSCNNNSNIETITITKDQKLVFSEEDDFGFKSIVITNNNKTITIESLYFIREICYLKQVYPEKDITIQYHKNKKGEISWLNVAK